MRVIEVELIPFALPFARPYTTARGTLHERELLLVRLVTDGDHVGLGEAVPLGLRGGASLRAIQRSLLRAARRFRRADLSDFAGEDATRAAVETFIHVAAGRRLPGPARAALEMALFDLAGKAAGKPVWRLLGAGEARPVRCNATLVAGTPDEVAADAERWAAQGFQTFKLKAGAGDDVAMVRAVREAVGPQAKLRLDANGAWSMGEAQGVLRMVEPLGIELLEQPVSRLRDLAELTAQTTVLVAADESVERVKDAQRAAAAGACDVVGVKLAKVGGLGEANGISQHLPIYLSSALDGPLGIAAAAHAAQALSFSGPAADLSHGLATQRLFAATTAARGPRLDGDLLRVPDGPGLGVEIDEDSLADLRI